MPARTWANTKAAYRFLSNARVDDGDILSGHFAATRARCDASDCGPILLLQDTTEFSFQRANVNAVGVTKSVNSGRDKKGRVRHHTVCGMLMHSSLAVTTRKGCRSAGGGEILDAEEIQGNQSAEEEGEPDPRADRRKKRACAGSRISDNRSNFSDTLIASFMSETEKATFSSFIA